MQPDLARGHLALRRRREAFLGALAPLGPDTLGRKPSAEAWSLAQLADHLVRVETALAENLERALARPEPRDVPALAPARALLLRAVQRLPVRIKTPPGATVTLPAVAPDLAATAEAWRALDDRLAQALGGFGPGDEKRAAFRHPVAGLLTARGALVFASDHFDHHLPQFRRTLRAIAPEHEGLARKVARAASEG